MKEIKKVNLIDSLNLLVKEKSIQIKKYHLINSLLFKIKVKIKNKIKVKIKDKIKVKIKTKIKVNIKIKVKIKVKWMFIHNYLYHCFNNKKMSKMQLIKKTK